MGNWSIKPVTLPAIEFDGDAVVFSVKRLLVEDMQVLAKYYDRSTGKMVFGSPLEVCQTAQEILPKYVQSIAGMTKEDGTDITVAEFMEASKEFYFVALVGQLFAHLVDASTAKSQEKNSEPPSPKSSEA